MKPKPSYNYITALFFLFCFFGAGGGTVESFVNYPTWLLIGENEFQAFHQALGSRIIVTMVIPMLLSTVFNILLFWYRPPVIPRWTIWATLVLALISWISSALIQIPIQIQLSETGYSREAIERLIATDIPLRAIPNFIRLGIAFRMLVLAVGQPIQKEKLAVQL